MSLELLPEDCFAHILSLTSPADACRSSLVSLSLHFIADSDSVWEKFLPSDYKEIISRLVTPIVYSSIKELFLSLCNPCPMDGGNKIFSLERKTGKKCYILSARELSITWASNHLYWALKPLQESRFAEVAELITMWWLEIGGSISTRILSPNTVYGSYLLVKFADRAYGLDYLPSEVSLEVGNFKSQGKVHLSHFERKKQPPLRMRSGGSQCDERGLAERRDGWMEIELGGFYNNNGNDMEVKMSLKEVKGHHLKGGLIVEGIELRPIN